MKNKFELEYTLNSSPKILFPRLSTPGGLSEWFADDINIQGNIFTFRWEGTEEQAEMVSKKENQCIRFKWVDDEIENTYFEFKINQDELTGDVALVITDFADDDEKESTIELWNSQIADLKRTLGL
ncbi:MAG: hypothetical protein A2W99_14555 [Bacteroidetes bacterium GWF2_33_16]|nr:MAG: hypothetical protein A2X00_08765 [Bacteroidetes bacterium GWE2_32_14]OFY04895.1 MAG: hypothetical protein A2W99_14555 [Bacteroidetes bacterium GWF2_33_16]